MLDQIADLAKSEPAHLIVKEFAAVVWTSLRSPTGKWSPPKDSIPAGAIDEVSSLRRIGRVLS